MQLKDLVSSSLKREKHERPEFNFDWTCLKSVNLISSYKCVIFRREVTSADYLVNPSVSQLCPYVRSSVRCHSQLAEFGTLFPGQTVQSGQ